MFVVVIKICVLLMWPLQALCCALLHIDKHVISVHEMTMVLVSYLNPNRSDVLLP